MSIVRKQKFNSLIFHHLKLNEIMGKIIKGIEEGSIILNDESEKNKEFIIEKGKKLVLAFTEFNRVLSTEGVLDVNYRKKDCQMRVRNTQMLNEQIYDYINHLKKEAKETGWIKFVNMQWYYDAAKEKFPHLECGTIAEAKKRGLLRLEGKTYIVQDGDVINFLFNV